MVSLTGLLSDVFRLMLQLIPVVFPPHE